MPRTRLVTVSGMVGSGKSTLVDALQRTLTEDGVDFERWRFQRLACIRLRPQPKNSTPSQDDEGRPSGVSRGQGYRRQTLTPLSAVGHCARLLAFRAYLWWPRHAKVVVCDRYFYDSFVHFNLRHGPTRLYTHLLARLVPQPDLAFLLTASPATVASRRPNYSADYIEPVSDAYQAIPEWFPYLVALKSDEGAPTPAVANSYLAALFRRGPVRPNLSR